TLAVTDPCGERVDNADYRLSAFRIYVSMSASTRGTYEVDYNITSAYDSHVTTGTFTFVSTGGAECAGAAAGVEEQERSESSGDGDPGEVSGAGGNGDGAGNLENGAGGSNDRGPGGGRERGDDVSRARSGERGSAAQLAAPRERREADESIWAGIEFDEFAIALAIAALIGAAGGKVYAGIVGPRA
ncbi:MAG: copper resistance protein CopC, partial [Actinomycetota bacterium]|nr:copper resistance protein CopC [Actinomycetota bacterium]